MFEFFDTIFKFFETIVNFVTGFVENIVWVFGQIASGLNITGLALIYMPDLIRVFVTGFIAYSVIINLIHLGD